MTCFFCNVPLSNQFVNIIRGRHQSRPPLASQVSDFSPISSTKSNCMFVKQCEDGWDILNKMRMGCIPVHIVWDTKIVDSPLISKYDLDLRWRYTFQWWIPGLWLYPGQRMIGRCLTMMRCHDEMSWFRPSSWRWCANKQIFLSNSLHDEYSGDAWLQLEFYRRKMILWKMRVFGVSSLN